MTIICHRCLRIISTVQNQISVVKRPRKHNFYTSFGSKHSTQTLLTRAMANQKLQNTFMVVGLGNPDMPRTRHSIGMRLVDYLAQELQVEWTTQRKLKAHVAGPVPLLSGGIEALSDGSETSLSHTNMVLVRSKLAMNLNGKSIALVAQHFNIERPNIYILHDDLDKPLGKFSIKEGGSARGHNGVRSAVQSLRTDEFPRLRIGIGRPEGSESVTDYVLSPFHPAEQKHVKDSMDKMAATVIKHIESRVNEAPS